MTTFDTPAHPVHARTPLTAPAGAASVRALIDDLRDEGSRFGVVLGGQGAAWLPTLASLVRDHGAGAELAELVARVEARLEPVAAELARVDARFTPLAWADALAAGESVDAGDAPAHPSDAELAVPALSVPGILLTQVAAIRAMRAWGIDTDRATAAAGHSQGALAVEVLRGRDEADVLVLARLAGIATQVVARRRGLTGSADAPVMVSVGDVVPGAVDEVLASLPGNRAVSGLRNGRRAVVVTGPSADVAAVLTAFERRAASEREAREKKQTGGAAFAPVVEPLGSAIAFHHPDLAEAAELAAGWAATLGLDPDWARDLTRVAFVDPVDWVGQLDGVLASGAEWLLDLGPAALAATVTAGEAGPRGVGIVSVTTRRGRRELTVPGAAPVRPTPWSSHLPTVVHLPDGTVRLETAFTRLTGKSPVLLAGMTPTTVDAKIVAAAANAGFWAELAGGGQVTAEIFHDRMAELDELLEPGRSFSFNSLLLDPYLWKLQLGQQRLVQRARAAGSPIDSVIVTAGVPELDEAVALVADLHEVGIEHVVFKPGTVRQIRQVLEIGKALAEAEAGTSGTSLIIQIEGGQAGGHHSWEDLDELLIATYSDLRSTPGVVVCVGGGIGTPEAASSYLTGEWARRHDLPLMPVDGVLVGTAGMAAAEATTSPQVKQLLVDTPGTAAWIGAGKAVRGMSSGRSQLGADIHEIDNTASRTGRLLDEVAGDADAVAARHDEIVVALDATAKPYFGDVAHMAYGAMLERFAALTTVPDSDGSATWIDVSFRDRFHELAQRAEARLVSADHGPVPTLFPEPVDVTDPAQALATLRAEHTTLDEVVLHPADTSFFLDVCRRPGKPVTFVPVIDADVRRWWRSDSLWQAHDARYGADAVCVIPGPVAVRGITRVDEPVAELLQRFEDETIDGLLAAGRSTCRVSGRRRDERAPGVLGLVLAAHDVLWAGRTVVNPVHRLGADGWSVTSDTRADHAPTGATLLAHADRAVLTVPVGNGRAVELPLDVPASTTLGAAPVVEVAAAAAAMTDLLRGAAGGSFPRPGGDSLVHAWSWDLVADHAGVTTPGTGSSDDLAEGFVPDVLVGLAWPTVFAELAAATTATGLPVVEGALDLVHLDHEIAVLEVPAEGDELSIAASVASVEDTEVGRVVTIDVQVRTGTTEVARLRERLAIRGRSGAGSLTDPQRGGGLVEDPRDTPRRSRSKVAVAAPVDMRAFAAVSGDHNPIHTSDAAALLAGLGSPIVHGMWVSALAQRAVGRPVEGWTARFLAPVRLGAALDVRVDRVALDRGSEVVEVTVRADGELAMAATARVVAPRTAYVFPGQGIQHAGMGMDGYQRSAAARDVWDRADAHTREVLGFSILTVVRDNPTLLVANGVAHRHPDGVLFLTQFTQVAMAVLGSAQTAELREAGAFVEGAVLAGHSVGEYNALAAVSGVIPLEAVVEVVFQRGSVMHTLVERDADGRSDYRLAAIRPSQIGLDDSTVGAYVDELAERTGEFLQIVNLNLRDSQYALAGSVRGLKALEADIAERRERFNGKGAFILVPGIDVPFHSRVLHGGVDDFRARLDELLPAEIDPDVLIGRYVPNLVPRPFSLGEAYVTEVAELVDPEGRGIGVLRTVLADFDTWSARPGALCRTLLIELLAWQFASPVRWIETQDLMFAPTDEGGLGVERLVEIGVGQSPTIANLAASTLKLPVGAHTRRRDTVQVLNVERDAAVVLASDEEPVVDDEPEVTDEAPSADAAPAAAAAPASGGPATQTAADLPFAASDATSVLIAWWTKLRPEQIGAADTIESLCDGASSRRNQLLLDLGGELSLGAIDGAAEADIPTLGSQVNGLARGYKPLGPVLSAAIGDHLKKVLGPTGKRPATISDRVTQTWGLGAGWAQHVLVRVALDTREGASVRGGQLGELTIGSAGDLDAAVDAAVAAVAAAHGTAVQMPSAGGGGGGTVDVEALGELTAHIAGPDGALASAARIVLDKLGLADVVDHAAQTEAEADDAAVLELVEKELGPDWATKVTPVFDTRRALLLDDRWASAREDLVRIAHGEDVSAEFTGTGEVVARQARFWAANATDPSIAARFEQIAADATATGSGPWSDEVAVVTGASPGSIASAVVGELLAGGATVVATTSSLNPSRLAAFRELYRSRARGGAALWVVPANMASFTDVDALASWVVTEQSDTSGPVATVVKPALTPTLLLPFAAGPVRGDLADAGPSNEIDMRILVWSVERLVGAFALEGRAHDIASRLHVVLPGSPNRGTFGGDGAYGEAKAALDAIVAKWRVEKRWSQRVTLVHALIGWVRGTGLMGGNDPLVAAVEAKGIRTWAPEEMAAALLEACTPRSRDEALRAPLVRDLTGGLAGADVDLPGLAASLGRPSADAAPEVATISALAPSPNAPRDVPAAPSWPELQATPEDLVVIVGAGELGPYGSSRTRFEAEVEDRLSAAGVAELAWSTGLIRWEKGTWIDVESDEDVAEADLVERYHDVVRERVGVREYADDTTITDHTVPLLASVFLDADLTFTVGSRAEAEAMKAGDPEHTRITPAEDGDWTVTRLAGTEIRVPRRMKLTRTVGGQIPTGFDPTVWGVPAEMVESVDRVALWNLVCTVDAFLSSGFNPTELMRWVHPAFVANTQGTGMGGMTSMQSLYIDTLLGEAKANDILQEALPNVIAAHVVQSYVGSYGAMVHPVAACATTAVSVEEGVDKIRLGKAQFVVAGGFDDLSAEGIIGFADMSATADTEVMRAKGLEDRYLSRANDRRRGGFVESQGGGTILLARGDVALAAGLPVLGVVAYAGSFADGVHTSIPAPGIGALAAGLGGAQSPLGRGLSALGLTHDDVALVSKHDTSTAANDPNESDLHERISAALGRDEGRPLYVVSQKTLTGHAKGGAAAFQLIGLCQVLEAGTIPPNRSLDCVDDVLAEHEHLVWLRKPLATSGLRAGLVTSLGFGHVAGLIALAHPAAFLATVPADQRAEYLTRAEARRLAGRRRLVEVMHGGEPAYQRPADRRLGDSGVKTREAALLLDPEARLVGDVYSGPGCA
ncbi:type I polyketide synthase [Aeromicrobium sp. Leaf350]|uniref:type I polyketide synthase n=1 Tax=Aeromicrobium sp. Leaf350 TaxID=2876565 RepID=UPI001E4A8A48|nr:type I polyketide synthase [Aeromicrobium sp. Leaf350]